MKYTQNDFLRPYEEMITILGLNGATTIPFTQETFKNMAAFYVIDTTGKYKRLLIKFYPILCIN